MLAKDIMVIDVVTITADTPVKEAALLLIEHGISGIPVVDDKQHLLGIITKKDLNQKTTSLTTLWYDMIYNTNNILSCDDTVDILGSLVTSAADPVSDIMSTPVTVARDTAPIAEIAALMVHQGVNRVPIVDADNRLAGIIARQDILMSMVQAPETLAPCDDAVQQAAQPISRATQEILDYINTIMLAQGLSLEEAQYSASQRYAVPEAWIREVWNASGNV